MAVSFGSAGRSPGPRLMLLLAAATTESWPYYMLMILLPLGHLLLQLLLLE